MTFGEAMVALEKGKRVRAKIWDSNRFVYKSGKNTLIDDSGKLFYLDLQKLMDEEWEEYEKKTVDKWLNPTCYEYGGFSCECPICHKTTLITKTPEFPNLIYYCMYCGTKNIVKE